MVYTEKTPNRNTYMNAHLETSDNYVPPHITYIILKDKYNK